MQRGKIAVEDDLTPVRDLLQQTDGHPDHFDQSSGDSRSWQDSRRNRLSG